MGTPENSQDKVASAFFGYSFYYFDNHSNHARHNWLLTSSSMHVCGVISHCFLCTFKVQHACVLSYALLCNHCSV